MTNRNDNARDAFIHCFLCNSVKSKKLHLEMKSKERFAQTTTDTRNDDFPVLNLTPSSCCCFVVNALHGAGLKTYCYLSIQSVSLEHRRYLIKVSCFDPQDEIYCLIGATE